MGLFDVLIVVIIVMCVIGLDSIWHKSLNRRTQITADRVWGLWHAGRLTGEEAGKLLSSLRGDG